MTMSWFAPHDPPVRTRLSRRAWKSVLVPLDGSELSCSAVARARYLLERPGIAVTLLRVIECREDRANDLGYQMDSRHRTACEALEEVRAGVVDRSAEVGADVRFGDPATEIRQLEIDSVALTTHARTGLARAISGSVTQELMRGSDVPILTLCNLRRRLPLPASALEHRHVTVG